MGISRLHPRRTALTVALALAASVCAWLAPAAGAAPRMEASAVAGAAAAPNPWLHTRGMTILDPQNRPVLLTGFNQGDMYNGQGNDVDECGRYWLTPRDSIGPNTQRWGLNSIRLFIAWANLEPTPPTLNPDGTITHHWNQRYLEALDHVVANLHKHHVYLVPVMQAGALSPAYKDWMPGDCEGSGMPAWLFPNAANETYKDGWCHFLLNEDVPGVPIRPLDGFAAAWKKIARRYANDSTVVALDMINEPAHDLPCNGSILPVSNLDDLNRRIGRAIRSVNRRVLLVLEGQNHSDGTASGITRAGLDNVIYTWHSYPPDWRTGKPALQAALEEARKLDAPLWLGEFSGFNTSDNFNPPVSPTAHSDLKKMMTFLRANDISWSFQNYSGQWSITVPNTDRPKRYLLSLLQHGVG